MKRATLQERALEIFRASSNLTLDDALILAAEEHARLHPDLPAVKGQVWTPPQGRMTGAERNG